MPAKRTVYSLTVIVLLAFTGCTQRIYLPALLHNDISYLPRPMATDTVKTSQYIAGGVTFAEGSASMNDNIFIGQLNYSGAHTFKYINIAYGAYGFGGSYSNNTYSPADGYYFSDKSFFGFGGRASANFFAPVGRADIRILGIELSYSKEFGDYLAYRRSVKNQPGFTIDDRSALFTGGLTTEVIWHGAKNYSNQFGFRVFIGKNFGGPTSSSNDYYDYHVYPSSYTSSISYFLKIHRYLIVLEGGNGIQIKAAYQF
ncbi:hypothetical protein ACFGVR_19450 [Mucilaginibacter sp. AW1-3]